MPFNFTLLNVPWTAEAVRSAVDEMEAALPEGAWPNWVLGNHDESRVASRIGAAAARCDAPPPHPPGDAYPVLRRRAGDGGRAGPARACPGSVGKERPWPWARPRSGADPDALGWKRERRVHAQGREALASPFSLCGQHERGGASGEAGQHAQPHTFPPGPAARAPGAPTRIVPPGGGHTGGGVRLRAQARTRALARAGELPVQCGRRPPDWHRAPAGLHAPRTPGAERNIRSAASRGRRARDELIVPIARDWRRADASGAPGTSGASGRRRNSAPSARAASRLARGSQRYPARTRAGSPGSRPALPWRRRAFH